MKIHDFGLWFKFWNENDRPTWSTTIPQENYFHILYDGMYLGCQYTNFELCVVCEKLHIIKLKNKLLVPESKYRRQCWLGRKLTLDDFEIASNPDYKGVHSLSF